jgi:hypothetical protein
MVNGYAFLLGDGSPPGPEIDAMEITYALSPNLELVNFSHVRSLVSPIHSPSLPLRSEARSPIGRAHPRDDRRLDGTAPPLPLLIRPNCGKQLLVC